jgi:hypothetical protein
MELTGIITRGTEELAEREGLAIRYLNSASLDKEAIALENAREHGLSQGRIAVISCVEACNTFRMRHNRGNGHIEIRAEPGRCNHYYHYFLHPRVGLCYVRLQTWFPFTMRVGLNGREWLFRQLQNAGIGYTRQENLLLAVDDWTRAQALLDDQLRTDWPAFLNDLAAQTNPLLPYLHDTAQTPYYWMTEQSEWATDAVFRSADDLARLYPRFVRHCIDVLKCRDILRFLGKKTPLQGIGKNCRAAVKADLKERHEGLRAKMWVNSNSLKLYDKQAVALRLETTINQPKDFTVFRTAEGDEEGEMKWLPLRKGVADLHRRAEVSQRANDRLAESLATVAEPMPLGKLLEPLARPVFHDGRRARALNPMAGPDAALLEVLAQGEHLLHGFRNRDIRQALHGDTPDATETRRLSAAVSRKLRLLRAHGLISKIQKTNRYQITAQGRRILSALLAARKADVTKLAEAA